MAWVRRGEGMERSDESSTAHDKEQVVLEAERRGRDNGEARTCTAQSDDLNLELNGSSFLSNFCE